MARTKKVGRAGRFGPRYGVRVKKKILEVEQVQKVRHTCPNCIKPGLKRLSKGVWLCKKCGAKFTGRAYKPT